MAPEKETNAQVAFRLPEDLIKEIDKYVEYMSSEHPGVSFNRSDAVRALLTHALGAVRGSAPGLSAKFEAWHRQMTKSSNSSLVAIATIDPAGARQVYLGSLAAPNLHDTFILFRTTSGVYLTVQRAFIYSWAEGGNVGAFSDGLVEQGYQKI